MVFQPFRCHPHPDADGVQETDNDGKANDGSKGKKRKRVNSGSLPCAGDAHFPKHSLEYSLTLWSQ